MRNFFHSLLILLMGVNAVAFAQQEEASTVQTWDGRSRHLRIPPLPRARSTSMSMTMMQMTRFPSAFGVDGIMMAHTMPMLPFRMLVPMTTVWECMAGLRYLKAIPYASLSLPRLRLKGRFPNSRSRAVSL